MSEEEFWNCTIAKLNSLYELHLNINSRTPEKKNEVQEGFIDEVLFI